MGMPAGLQLQLHSMQATMHLLRRAMSISPLNQWFSLLWTGTGMSTVVAPCTSAFALHMQPK